MVWFNVDDGFATHPKILSMPRGVDRMAAVGLWTIAGSWCSKHLTDGNVPEFMVHEWGADAASVSLLVAVNLWEITPDGYVFHNWEKWGRTREEVEEAREAERVRKATYRALKAGEKAKAPVKKVSRRRPTGTPAGVPRVSQHPSQSLPSQSLPSQSLNLSAQKSPSEFEQFYAAYPRKVNRPAAETAWAKAITKASGDVIIARTQEWRNTLPEKLTKEDLKFLKHPGPWLNAEGWNDDFEHVAAIDTPRPAQAMTRVEENLAKANAMRAREAAIAAAQVQQQQTWPQHPDPQREIRR